MRTRRGRLLERHWLRLFCQVAAKVLYMCIYIEETNTKIPQHRWGCQITPSKLCFHCKKKTAVGVSNYALQELLPVYDALQRRGIPLASNQVLPQINKKYIKIKV